MWELHGLSHDTSLIGALRRRNLTLTPALSFSDLLHCIEWGRDGNSEWTLDALASQAAKTRNCVGRHSRLRPSNIMVNATGRSPFACHDPAPSVSPALGALSNVANV